MKTEVIRLDPVSPDAQALQRAAGVLKNGGLVIFPTETVYGIGANMQSAAAVERLYAIKKRPANKPFSIHLSNADAVEQYAKDVPAVAWHLMDAFWPGPLTLILKGISYPTVGLRLPDNRIALDLIAGAGVPVVAPSANISDKEAPVDFSQAIKDFDGVVEVALDGGRTKFGIESSIVDASVHPAKIVRVGAVKQDMLEAVLRQKTVLFICTGNTCRSPLAKFYLEKRLKDAGRDDVTVLSRGIMAMEGMGASPEVRKLLLDEGIDATSHISQRIGPEAIKRSDIILVMEKMHEEEIKRMMPQAAHKVFLLKEFAKIHDDTLNILDPIGKPLEVYQDVFAVIKEAAERIVEVI